MSKTTISIICTEEEKAEIGRRREIRGYRSDNEYTRHLLQLGTLVEEAMAGKRLNPDNFAAAFFTIVSKVLDEGVRAILEAGTAEELREWSKSELEAAPLIVGKISRPVNQ